MSERDAGAQLRTAFHGRAERAMTLTDTDRELERLRKRLRPARRTRRLGVVAAVAAAAALLAGIGLAAALGNSSHGTTTPGSRPGPGSAGTLPAGPIPTGFPVGTFKHPGTFGLTQLTLSRGGTATLADPRDDVPTVMAMTFTTPAQVSFDITSFSASTIQCDGIVGTYAYVVAGGQLRLTPVDDVCTQRRIPLSEEPWGPIPTAIPVGFPTGTFEHPGAFGKTVLHLARDGSASLRVGAGPAGQMATTFTSGSIVEFALLHHWASAAAPACARPGVYRWSITGRQLTFTVVQDGCGVRRIPLSEHAWGPLSDTR